MGFQFSAAFFRNVVYYQNCLVNLQFADLAGQEDCIQFIGDFYERGLQVLISDDNDDDPEDVVLQSLFRVHYATVLLRATPDGDRAVSVLEDALKDIEASRMEEKIRTVFEDARTQLCMHYLRECLRAKQTGDVTSVDRLSTKMSTLAHRGNSSSNSRDSTLVFAVCERIKGRISVSTDILRPAIFVAIDMLTDETDENDKEGWDRIANALTAAGDVPNAIAALRYGRQYFEMLDNQKRVIRGPDGSLAAPVKGEPLFAHDEQDSPATENNDRSTIPHARAASVTQRRKTYRWRSCDGCFVRISTRPAYYRCNLCLFIDLCEDCHGLLRDGKLKQQICDGSHEFLHLPEETGIFPKGKIEVNDKDVLVSDWLEDLKKQWSV